MDLFKFILAFALCATLTAQSNATQTHQLPTSFGQGADTTIKAEIYANTTHLSHHTTKQKKKS